LNSLIGSAGRFAEIRVAGAIAPWAGLLSQSRKAHN
jgi:hypothetical protein